MYQGKHSRQAVLAQRRRAHERKKATVLASLALVGVLLVGGTIAFLVTSSGAVENTFEPSSVSSVVEETFDDGDKVKKDVRVKNTGDIDAFIRASIVVNWVDEQGDILAEAPEKDVDYSLDLNSSDWVVIGGYYYHKAPVKQGESTSLLINECKVLRDKAGYSLQVDVIGSAIQADGMTMDEAKDEEVPVAESVWGVNVVNGAIAPSVQDN